MHELQRMRFSLYQLVAAPETIDEVDPGPGWTILRIAEDEALLLGPSTIRMDRSVLAAVATREQGAYFGDVVDGWTGCLLQGDSRYELLARLTPLSVKDRSGPDEFVQGDVLGIPGKLLALPDAIVVLWPATFTAYVGQCLADAGLSLIDAPEIDWAECVAAARAVTRTVG